MAVSVTTCWPVKHFSTLHSFSSSPDSGYTEHASDPPSQRRILEDCPTPHDWEQSVYSDHSPQPLPVGGLGKSGIFGRLGESSTSG